MVAHRSSLASLLDRQAVARRLGICYSRVVQLQDRGDFHGILIEGKFLFDANEIEVYATQRQERLRPLAKAKPPSTAPLDSARDNELRFDRERDELLRELDEIDAQRRKRSQSSK